MSPPRVPRAPFIAVAVAAVLTIGLAACDDGDSKDAKPGRSTTTTSSTTTTTTIPGGATTTTLPSTSSTTPADPVGTCGNQTAAIVSAIAGTTMGGENTRAGQYTVQRCRIAASSPIWAAADIVPNPGRQLDVATVVLQRIGALWNVEDVGTSGVGCSAPANIITDLGLVC